MEIKRDSKLFRWAYYFEEESEQTRITQVSLCSLFWNCVLLSPLKIAFCSVVDSFAYAVTFLFGAKPIFISGDNHDPWEPYERWPLKIENSEISGYFCPGNNICLWTVFCAALFGGAVFFLTQVMIGIIFFFYHAGVVSSLAVLTLIVLFWRLWKFRKTELWTLTKGYLKAKKEGINFCPTIKIVD